MNHIINKGILVKCKAVEVCNCGLQSMISESTWTLVEQISVVLLSI
jgi:hypothetical protein